MSEPREYNTKELTKIPLKSGDKIVDMCLFNDGLGTPEIFVISADGYVFSLNTDTHELIPLVLNKKEPV